MIDLDTGEAIIEESLEELELNEITDKESLVEEREEKSDLSVSEEVDGENQTESLMKSLQKIMKR